MEVQSFLVAEVVGGAKPTAQKSSFKKLNHLWEEVSMTHDNDKRQAVYGIKRFARLLESWPGG